MKSFARLYLSAVILLLFLNPVHGQKAAYTTNGGITIGFGTGVSYQQSDIANSRGAGFDFTFGSYLYKRENAFLSADWKFRFLAGANMAFDHRENPDGTFSNIQFTFFDYDAELGLTLNRLKERTRIIISAFAGAGITHGITHTDLLDANNNPYDFSTIDPTQPRKTVYADLVALSDGSFETKLQGKGALLPTAGLYLGYQFTRSFSIGIEHKINFSMSESNGFAGIDIDNRIDNGSRKDRNHYTSIGFIWALGGGGRSSARTSYNVVTTPVVTNNNIVRPPDTPPVINNNPVPVVEIIVPSAENYSTSSTRLDINARVLNVRGKQDIRVLLNNSNVPFEYNPVYTNVKTTLQLQEGRNVLLITATNETGSARDESVIICTRPAPAALPTVKFIDPASLVTTEKAIYSVSAQTRNVKAWQDVTVKVNGTITTNFNFSNEGVVMTNVALLEGVNTIEITGKNESGTATDKAIITRSRPVKAPAPVVTFITPAAASSTTFEENQEIRATVTGINMKTEVTLSVNGLTVTAFNYDPSTALLTTLIQLRDGNNTVSITAKNGAGQDSKSRSIIKEAKPCPPPALAMINPSQADAITENASYSFSTEVKNVTSRQQVSVTLNGKPVQNFTFNGNTVVAPTTLNQGINNYRIAVSTPCGTTDLTSSVYYKQPEVIIEKPCLKPVLNINLGAVNRTDINYELKGTAVNIKSRSEIKLTVNNSPSDAFTFNQATGEITAGFKFTPGNWTVSVTVKNECGSDVRNAFASIPEPCVPPVLNISVSQGTAQGVSHILKGTVTGVTDRKDLTITVDGTKSDNFNFVPATGELTAGFKFEPGTHTIKADVKNNCGSDSKTVTVSLDNPCTPPTLNIGLAAASRNDISIELKGTAANVKSKSDVSVKVNGAPFETFNFVPNTGEITAAFKFNPGSYTIVVEVKNECGTESRSVSTTIEQPCIPPVLNLNLSEVNRTDVTHELRGKVTNIKNKTDITVTVNGNPFEGFSFVPNTGDFTATFKFNPGTYNIKVEVKNECGSDSRTFTTTVEQPCLPPALNINLAEVNRTDVTHELRGKVTNIKNKTDIKVTVNGNPFEGFSFVPNTGDFTATFKFNPGTYNIRVEVKNECGSDSKTFNAVVSEPCDPPSVSATLNEVARPDANFELKGSVKGVSEKSEITITVNGNMFQDFTFAGNEVTAAFKLNPGNSSIKISVKNNCGSDSKTFTATVPEPCVPPQVDFSLTAVTREGVSHDLKGKATNVTEKSGITISVNEKPFEAFSFVPGTGEIKASLNLEPGSYVIKITVKNECGTDDKTTTLKVEEKPCGVRINPGNSAWEFCMVTPSGTFDRDTLTNRNFSYSGSASSLFFKPIAGGGDAVVNGKPYVLKPGQYYLFKGNLSVTLSSRNPGSMGQWSVCIRADREPVTGNGNDRPQSPCEQAAGNEKPKRDEK